MTDAPVPRQPRGELQIRTLAMPADTNPNGDIFGGWLLAQMDVAGGIYASHRAGGRSATVAIDAMTFHLPVFVGDVVCCYADLERVGRTSMTIHIEAWVIRRRADQRLLVTEGRFTYVAIGDDGRPRPVPPG
ncbi:MAG: acyl-CoA thioesterase [Alphaproteobacteria bacterium]|nr:acyl-CoA thioesterase [Alphaproteobacteria bacterium]